MPPDVDLAGRTRTATPRGHQIGVTGGNRHVPSIASVCGAYIRSVSENAPSRGIGSQLPCGTASPGSSCWIASSTDPSGAGTTGTS